jgi:hypothetical protein
MRGEPSRRGEPSMDPDPGVATLGVPIRQPTGSTPETLTVQVTVASPRLGRQTRRPAEGRQGSGALRCSAASLKCPHEPYFWQQKSLPSRESAPYSHGLWWLLTLGTPVRDAAKFQAYRSGEAASPIQMGLSRQRADLRAPHWPILHIHRRKPA